MVQVKLQDLSTACCGGPFARTGGFPSSQAELSSYIHACIEAHIEALETTLMKILTIVGARPQFIKAAAITRVLNDIAHDNVEEIMVHTGQHYDAKMSQVFFDELEIPEPKYNLGIAAGTHGDMTGRMLIGIEKVILDEKPDWLLVYGDTNSTIAGALAASKTHLPIAHVEAGLRSFNMRMPEEINRIVTDRISTLLFCPTVTAVENLRNEGMLKGVHNVGDVMYDQALFFRDKARERSRVLEELGVRHGDFILVTCHRAENTDDQRRLTEIVNAIEELAEQIKVVFPLHPRTRKLMDQYGLLEQLKKALMVDPLPFLDMVALEQAAKVILTDSGGVQKEAFFYNVPCVTMRDETEWIETVDLGWNFVTGASHHRIVSAVLDERETRRPLTPPYGDGAASKKIVAELLGSS
jgi:UDP-GlcNAc3NAcA epimerase